MTETFLKDQVSLPKRSSMSAEMTKFRPPAVINKGNLAHRRPGRMPSRRARPLTRIQEVLFLAAAFFVGGLLQILVILYSGGILE